MTSAAAHGPDALTVEYCGEWYPVAPGSQFTIGRDADLSVDDNPFLHRRLLLLTEYEGMWMLHNIGSRTAVTITDGGGRLQSWLAPGARLPLVFGRTVIVFTAGSTTYELTVHVEEPLFADTHPTGASGTTTIGGDVPLTLSQRLLILSLAEPMLAGTAAGIGEIPSSADAARRLGWPMPRFNRKLDNVCEKLSRVGVKGLRRGPDGNAVNRRVRLVEYAVAARLVTEVDLPLLDQEGVRT